MNRSWKIWLGAVALLAFGGQVGRAEEAIELSPKFEPFTSEQTSASFDDSNVKFVQYANGNARTSGVVGGAEFVLLRPYGSAGLFDTGGPLGPGAQMNFNPSMRYWVGFQGADGLGSRIRYWDFNRNAAGPANTSLGVEFRTLDVELTQAADLRAWNFLFSGGLRYGEANVNRTDLNFLNSPFAGAFSGIGLTASAQASRNLNYSGSLRFVSSARWSALYGNSSVSIGGGPIGQNRDDLVNILELNIGPQFRRQLRNGAYLTLGAGIESQFWSNAVPVGPANSGYDIGFLGFGTSFAITR